MCTESPTQYGFNYFWSCMQSGSNLRTCVCGNPCHKQTQQNISDDEKIVIVTIDKTEYIHENTYNEYQKWNHFGQRPKYPSEFIDMETGTKYTFIWCSYYLNNTTNAWYDLSEWKYKYDNRYNQQTTSTYTGGEQIMEKKIVTNRVAKTRTVYDTVKSGGEGRHDWVNVRTPTET